jgi:hypothetical protein
VDSGTGTFKLYTFHAASGKTLFAGDAGAWPFPDNNAMVIPVVANGRVFVASYKTLSIFGLSDAPARNLWYGSLHCGAQRHGETQTHRDSHGLFA